MLYWLSTNEKMRGSLGAALGESQTEEDLEFSGFERKRSVVDGKAV